MTENVADALGENAAFIVGICLLSFEHYGAGVALVILSIASSVGRRKPKP